MTCPKLPGKVEAPLSLRQPLRSAECELCRMGQAHAVGLEGCRQSRNAVAVPLTFTYCWLNALMHSPPAAREAPPATRQQQQLLLLLLLPATRMDATIHGHGATRSDTFRSAVTCPS